MTQIKPNPRVFLIGNSRKPEVPPAFERLSKWLDEQGYLIGSDLSGRPETILEHHPDYVVVLGGDGTILSVGQALQHQQVPILGVNLGKLGYLADFTVDELERFFPQILEDHRFVTNRMMLDILIADPAGAAWRGVAVNDCVFRAGMSFRTIDLAIIIDGEPLTRIVADGLIVSTPTGSTAHNMSCGGPILQPEVQAIILTPMAAHSLAHRPVVVGPHNRVEIVAQKINDGTTAVLDGCILRPIVTGARIAVRKADVTFKHVRNPQRTSWQKLVTKLKWGQNPV